MEMWITAIATVVIAIYAFMSYRLASKIKTKDDEFRQQVSDLFQAIAITNVLSGLGMQTGTTTLAGMKETFNEHYTGATKIFN